MDVAEVLRKLKCAKIFTVIELSRWLSCSLPTARRRLRDWDTLTSYNCNGRYYTLPEVPRFDGNGLWRCRGAFFSQHGNLKQTVSHLVSASAAGLTAAELSDVLGLEARSFLSHFREGMGLFRERRERGYMWFAGDSTVRERQREARQDMMSRTIALSDAEAVLLLVELVRNPRSSSLELTSALRPKIPRICPALIDDLLCSWDLEQKKGASDLRSY